MQIKTLEELFHALIGTTFQADVAEILTAIGDSPHIDIDKDFGQFNLRWHPFGNNPSNISTIGVGTKPGRSLTERITNAEDAILEDRAAPGVATPKSAREAAKQWFGRPISGPEDGLFKWNYSDGDHDKRIAVVLNPSGLESAPCVDVVDEGIGVSPEQFPGTILSLQSGNKIQKWYLIGAFGQGGASTLAFCEYALLVSRSRSNQSVVGFTIVKVSRLSEQYKEDTYAYLATTNNDGTLTVPSCEVGKDPVRLYPKDSGVWVPELKKGTLVRHFSYKLPYLDGALGPSPRNLYHYLHCSMFDPLIPFRLVDLRAQDPDKNKSELVTGSRNRLMKLVQQRAGLEDEDEAQKGSVMKHHRAMEYIVPAGGVDPCIGVEYWVVFNYRKPSGAKKDELILRPHSNELYLQTGHPIIGTLNGQNQGEMTSQILRELGLGMVARHIIIHIDATNADRKVRRELFASTREGFKDGPVLTEITQVLRRMLEEDANLYALEKELTEKLAQREAKSTSDEVKKQVTRLLLEAGLQVRDEGTSTAPGGTETMQTTRPGTRKRPVRPDPLPTLPFPSVTKFKITTPTPKMNVAQNDIEYVLVETDADAEFDRRGLVAWRCEPEILELASKSPLRGGRVRWRFRPHATARASDTAKLIVTITKPDGSQLSDSVDVEILPPYEEKVKKAKGLIPPFEIIPIDPVEDAEVWAQVWPDLADGEDEEKQASVAYKPLRVAGAINVYYSTAFSPFKQMKAALVANRPAVADFFVSNYEVWIGYHAILQESSTPNAGLEIEQLDDLLEEDRVRVAQMQVRQSLAHAETTQKLMQLQAGQEP